MNSFFKRFRGKKSSTTPTRKEQASNLDPETLNSIYAAQRQLDILEQQFKQKQSFNQKPTLPWGEVK
jgi:hypothetical protein